MINLDQFQLIAHNCLLANKERQREVKIKSTVQIVEEECKLRRGNSQPQNLFCTSPVVQKVRGWEETKNE
jgi:hypothetical protein